MKKILVLLISTYILFMGIITVPALAFTGDIAKESFMVEVKDFFPSWSEKAKASSGKGIDNIPNLIKSMIPMLTTMMAVGATLMVVWGGFRMVLGGASSEHTEAGKGIMKDALIGLTIGLLAYVIIAFLGNIFNI